MLQVQDDVQPLCGLITALLRSEAAAQCSKQAKAVADSPLGGRGGGGGDETGLAAKKRKHAAVQVPTGPALLDGAEAASLQLPAEGQALKSLHDFAVRLLTGLHSHPIR